MDFRKIYNVMRQTEQQTNKVVETEQQNKNSPPQQPTRLQRGRVIVGDVAGRVIQDSPAIAKQFMQVVPQVKTTQHLQRTQQSLKQNMPIGTNQFKSRLRDVSGYDYSSNLSQADKIRRML